MFRRFSVQRIRTKYIFFRFRMLDRFRYVDQPPSLKYKRPTVTHVRQPRFLFLLFLFLFFLLNHQLEPLYYYSDFNKTRSYYLLNSFFLYPRKFTYLHLFDIVYLVSLGHPWKPLTIGYIIKRLPKYLIFHPSFTDLIPTDPSLIVVNGW